VGFALSISDLNPLLKRLDGRLRPVGIARLLWDIYVAKKVRRGRLILMGVRQRYHRRGLDSLLIVESFRRCRSIGWTGGELGWTLEDNEMINGPIRTAGAKLVSRYRVYEAELDPATTRAAHAPAADSPEDSTKAGASAHAELGGSSK